MSFDVIEQKQENHLNEVETAALARYIAFAKGGFQNTLDVQKKLERDLVRELMRLGFGFSEDCEKVEQLWSCLTVAVQTYDTDNPPPTVMRAIIFLSATLVVRFSVSEQRLRKLCDRVMSLPESKGQAVLLFAIRDRIHNHYLSRVYSDFACVYDDVVMAYGALSEAYPKLFFADRVRRSSPYEAHRTDDAVLEEHALHQQMAQPDADENKAASNASREESSENYAIRTTGHRRSPSSFFNTTPPVAAQNEQANVVQPATPP